MHYDECFFTDIGIGTIVIALALSRNKLSDISKVFFLVSLQLPPVLMPKEECT